MAGLIDVTAPPRTSLLRLVCLVAGGASLCDLLEGRLGAVEILLLGGQQGCGTPLAKALDRASPDPVGTSSVIHKQVTEFVQARGMASGRVPGLFARGTVALELVAELALQCG